MSGSISTKGLGVSKLASRFRVANISRPGYYMNFKAAAKAIEECSAAWVEYGVSIRDLTLAESIAARNAQARLREPLPYAEIHGLRFDPPISGIAATRRERKLTWEAHKFAAEAA
jgi:hypothetical protein